jgi:hypothetical protein
LNTTPQHKHSQYRPLQRWFDNKGELNMSISFHNHSPPRPVRLLICAVLACAITGVTTQVIVSSANHLQYGVVVSGVAAAMQADAGQHRGVARAS